MASRNAELHTGYTTHYGMADLPIATAFMHRSADTPVAYTGVKAKNVYRFFRDTFHGEKQLEDEKKLTLWNPIFIHSESIRDEGDHHIGIVRHLTTKKKIIEHMELVDQAKYVSVPTVMDAC